MLQTRCRINTLFLTFAILFLPQYYHLVVFRWGLIPFWAKDPSIGNKMINVRAETVDEKPSFKTGLQRKRCLIVADGFYDWKKEGSTKPLHRITKK